MANLYTRELLEQGPQHAKCGFSLFSLLTYSNEEFMVDGVRILQEGSSGWKSYLADFRERLRGSGRTPKEIEEIVKRRAASSKYIIVDDVPFYAMHYTFRDIRNNQPIEKRLIYNANGGVMGEIDVARKQIDFFRLALRPVDAAKKARMVKGYYYDETLLDALKEFEPEGYTFKLWNTTWQPHHLVNGEKAREISQVVPVRISIDELVKLQPLV